MTATETPKGTASEFPKPSRLKPRGTVKPGKRGRYRAIVLLAVHIAALAHILYWMKSGEAISPIEPSEAGETFGRGIVNAGFVLLGLAILSTLILGRWFCGWACHFVAYQDGCSWVLRKLGLKPTPLKSRLLVLVPLYVAYDVFFKEMVLGWFEDRPSPTWQVELTKFDWWETFPGLGMTILTVLVCGFLIVYWLGAKGFCTYGCPYGALFGIADRFAAMRIRVTDACQHCGHCTTVCTSNVQVHKEVAQHGAVFDSGCMKTMDCVSTCPNDALFFGRTKPAMFTKISRPRADLSWGEEIGAALLFVASVLSLRSLYGRVPFLLAVGASVMIAVLGIVLWRSLRSRSLTVQGRAWKKDGRFTGYGRFAAILGVLVFAFVGHSGLVRWHTVRGLSTWEDVNQSAATSASNAEEYRQAFVDRRADLERAAHHLQSSIDLGFLGNAPVLRDLASLEVSLGDLDQDPDRLKRAESLYREALDIEDHWSIRVALISLLDRPGTKRFDDIERLLRDGLADKPYRPQLTIRFANFLASQNRLDELIEFATPVFDRRPAIQLGLPLAAALHRTDKTDKALQVLTKSEELIGETGTADPGLAVAQGYMSLGKREDARRVLGVLLEMFPDDPRPPVGLQQTQ
ncbi:MAG: 4Fe-4S binding protein [Planctomycetota bacterium]